MVDIRLPYDARRARAVLGRLRADGDRFSAKLRTLDAHPGLHSQRGARSSGATLREWDRVSALADECAAQLRAHLDDMDRAAAILGDRGRVGRQELAELTAIFDGPADGSAGAVARVAAMDRAYDEVYAAVCDLERCATLVRQQLGRIDATLRELAAQAAGLPFPDGDTANLLDGLRREWEAIAPAAAADPKGCVDATQDAAGDGTPDRLHRLTAGIGNARSDLSVLGRQQAKAQASLVGLRERVDALAAVEAQCRHVDGDVRIRILGVPPAADPAAAAGLRQALDDLQRRPPGSWRQVDAAVRDLGGRISAALDGTLARHDTAVALLERRDELRGRLDAYRAMAIRLRHAEDLLLAAEYERAHDLLFAAPCDLVEADAAVSRYQRAVIDRTHPDDTVQSGGRDR